MVCGVDDSGKVVGQAIEDSTFRALTQSILANTDERLVVSISRLTLESKAVIAIEVQESPLKPHLAYGEAFKRMGTSTVALAQAEYRSMLAEKQNGHGADRDLLKDCTIAEINTEILYKFISIANEKRNSNFSSLADPLDILTSLELMHAGVLTKGAVLLFGKTPQKIVPAAEIRAACFATGTRDVFLDQQIIAGTLFEQFDAAMAFVRKHILIGADTSKIGSRTSNEFPLLAVQEMIANALVHRDYHDPASIYLNIVLRTGIEVTNPGNLPGPRITPETMPLIHASLPRNRRIARVFYLASIIEQWGMGGSRISRACSTAGLMPPQWISERGSVSVEIRAAKQL